MDWIGTFIAFIAAVGIGTIIAAGVSHVTTISTFRQKWINALREDLVEYFRALEILNHVAKAFAADPTVGLRDRKAEARANALMIFDRICLRLNKKEAMHIQLEAKLREFITEGLGEAIANRKKIDEAICLARDVLKAEWDVTKYPWRSWASANLSCWGA